MFKTRPFYLVLLLLIAVSVMPKAVIGLTTGSRHPIQSSHLASAEKSKPVGGNMPDEQPGNRDAQDGRMQGSIDPVLRSAVEHFIEAADKGDVSTISATYDPNFMSVRVGDEGGYVQLTRERMLAFFKNALASHPGGQLTTPAIPTQKTTIHFAEVVGDTGYVLLTRIKNIGNGWEPMFYNLVWKRQGDNWRLLREFVHQKSIPRRPVK